MAAPEPAMESAAKQMVPVDPAAVPVPKTKRAALISTSALLRALNAPLDEAALTRVYDTFYDEDGDRRDEYDKGVDSDDVYDILGESRDTTYVQTPVSDLEFNAFKQFSPVIEAQKMWDLAAKESAHRTAMLNYAAKMRSWRQTPEGKRGAQPAKPIAPPKNLDEAVALGDYFHVHNTTDLRPAQQDTKGRARRIIVNVKTQQAGLEVAKALNGLFSDPRVSPHLDHYKIFLTNDTGATSVKHDKLVVYYETDPADTGDTDKVGDRIAAAIDGSIKEGEYVDEFAPFYSRIGRGIAWAEEPESYVADLTDSFTGTRAEIITQVIDDDDNASVDGLDDFIARVRANFRARFVDPDNPHRHLAGKAPRLPQINKRKAPPKPAARIAAGLPLKPLPESGVPVTTGTGAQSPNGDKNI